MSGPHALKNNPWPTLFCNARITMPPFEVAEKIWLKVIYGVISIESL
jgi:hypothetical protein